MIVVAVLGLVLPGYVLARALDAPFAWAAAFPLSVFLLAETVIGFAICRVPLRFGLVLAVLAALTALVTAAWRLRIRSAAVAPLVAGPHASRRFAITVLTGVGLVVAALTVRTTLVPLCGADTEFRWDALPRLMLQYESLAYYPPVTAADFAKYTYPDGIPPLVAAVYWWLYAAWGAPNPNLTSIVIGLQLVSCLAFVYYGAGMLNGPRGGLMAVGLLATSTMFLRGVAIGQETGFTALSYAGQLAFALAAARGSSWTNAAMAALFAGLGGVAREYGPLLALCGLGVLVLQPTTRRTALLFCAIAAACSAPWYLRNWAITGNPLYSLDFFGFPSNPVHVGILATYHEMYAIGNISADVWLHVAGLFFFGAAALLVGGLLGLAVSGKQAGLLALPAAVALGLWVSAIAYTAGGIDSTLRVLNPFWIVLAIAGGALASSTSESLRSWRKGFAIAGGLGWLVAGAYSVAAALAFPFGVINLPDAIWSVSEEPMAADRMALAKSLQATNVQATGILTDDCYLAVALQRYTRFQPIVVWSPAASFIFDARLSPAEIRQRLIDNHIPIVSFWPESPNNTYLLNSPLYREDRQNWILMLAYGNVEALFALTRNIPAGLPVVTAP